MISGLVLTIALWASNDAPAAGAHASPVPVPVPLGAPAPPTNMPVFSVPANTPPAPTPTPVEFRQKLPAADASAILAKDLEDLSQILGGMWDNDLQNFLEPDLHYPTEMRHPRINVKMIPINTEAFGANTKNFLVEFRNDGENGAILKRRLWSFATSPEQMAIVMTPYDANANADFAALSAHPETLKRDDFSKVTGCEINFSRIGDNFHGETRAGQCKMTYSDGRILNVSEQHDFGRAIWEFDNIGVDADGHRVFGNANAMPTKFRRANMFSCWASLAQNTNPLIVNDIKLHDQGGTQSVTLGNQTIRLRLRSVEWPLPNVRPSLTLYLLQNNDDFAQIYSWTDIDAKRIALSYNAFQASCTRD